MQQSSRTKAIVYCYFCCGNWAKIRQKLNKTANRKLRRSINAQLKKQVEINPVIKVCGGYFD